MRHVNRRRASRLSRSLLLILVVAMVSSGVGQAYGDIFELPKPVGVSPTNPGKIEDPTTVWREGWGNTPLAEYTLTVPSPAEGQPAVTGAYYTITRPGSLTTMTPAVWPSCYNADLVGATAWNLFLDLPGEATSPGPLFNLGGWTVPAGAVLNRPYEGPYDLSFQYLAKDVATGAAAAVGLRLGLDMTPPLKVSGLKATPAYAGPTVNGWLTQSRVHLDWDDITYDSLAGTAYFEVFKDGKPYARSATDSTSRRVYDLKEHYPGYGFSVATRRGLTIEDLEAGEHYYQVRAVDRATNPGPLSDPVLIKCDPDIPKVTMISPSVDGERVGARPTFEAEVEDAGGVASVEFYVDGVLKATDTLAPFKSTMDLSAFADGSSHVLRVVARDVVGRSNFSDSIFVIDKTPSVAIVSPSSIGAVTGNPVLLSAVANDGAGIQSVTFVVDGSVIATVSPSVTQTSTIATVMKSIPSGSHTVTVTVLSVVGGTASASKAFIVDDALPVSVLRLAPPSTESTPLQGVSDTNPYSPTEVALFWREMWGTSLQPKFDILSPAYEPLELVDLFYSVDRDPYGKIDTSDPSTFYRSVRSAGTMRLSDIDQLGVLVSDSGFDGTILYPGKAKQAVEGVWFWHLVFRNRDGSINAVYDMPYGIDRTAPRAVSSLGVYRDSVAAAPVSGWLNQDRVVLRWDNSEHDSLSGTAYYRVYVDGVCAVPGNVSVLSPTTGDAGVPWYRPGVPVETLTLESMGAGRHTIEVTAVDRAGNESAKSPASTFWVDPDYPIVSLRRPASSTTRLGMNSYLTARATDQGGVTSVSFRVDGRHVGTVRPAGVSTSYVANVKPKWSLFAAGRHVVTVTVTDKVGRTTSVSREFVLDKTAPRLTVSSQGPSTFYPYLRDGYKDNYVARFKSSEDASASLLIYDYRGRLRRTISRSVRAGATYSLAWNGSLSGTGLELLNPMSTYTFTARVRLVDAAGNASTSSAYRTSFKFFELVRTGADSIRIVPR